MQFNQSVGLRRQEVAGLTEHTAECSDTYETFPPAHRLL